MTNEGLSGTLRDNIAAPVERERELAMTRFARSMAFVWLHIAVYGIFLSTFVLIGQNRMAVLADRSADLDLHISLLTEHELTPMAGLIDGMAQRLGVPVGRGVFAEVEQDVQAVEVLEAIDENRRSEDTL